MHYRRVVRTLQQGLPKSLKASEEVPLIIELYLNITGCLCNITCLLKCNFLQVKTQIALLFRDHAHLLEEYWVFYKQLHSTVQHVSDDEDEEEDEMETDSISSDQMVLMEESPQLEKAQNPSLVQVRSVYESCLKKRLFYFNMFCII